MMANELDAITLGVIQNGFQQICNEMDLTFVRSAFSPVITEGQDRADGIYHRETGELIAQGDFGLPIFVGTMQETTQSVISRTTTVEPGDVFAVNDPYLGGTHLMDVKFVKPFFYRGRLFAWLANTGHWPDIGGSVPGGYSAKATEIEQEGLRLPPVRLFKAGKLDDEILSIIMSNIRVAGERIGDIKAQAAALDVGEQRLTELIDRYGDTVVEAAIAELRARAAKQMRARIATIPDGVYKSETFVDSDGVDDAPLCIRLTLRKEREDLFFDLSESSPPCRGPMNSVISITRSAIRLRRGQARASFVMDHGRFGPPGALGGHDARLNEVEIMRSGKAYRPPHLSKDQDIVLAEGDLSTVRTPGGGGYGDPFKREAELVARDVRRGYFDTKDAAEEYGVVLGADMTVDLDATLTLRSRRKI